ncbi:MAG: hypothetical protein ABI847_03650 [Anaerolineales bacterium]
MLHKRFLTLRSLLIASLLLAALFGISRAPTAQASLGGCRADPVFVLSDGTILDVSVDIGTSVSNVTEISYVVHGPKGVVLVASLSTPTLGFKGLERVSYVGDGAANQYITDTLVQTSVKSVSATAKTVFAGNGLLALQLSLSAQYRAVQGLAGQHLISILNK